MVERFVETAGTISIGTGSSAVVGSSTTFGGRDREGAKVIAVPASGAPIYVGTVAAVEPRGVYDNLELPLVHPYNGDALIGVAYELIDGPAIANGTTQAATFARYAAFLERSMGLVGNTADEIDFSLVPNNSLFIDAVTRTIYQWRNGLLEAVQVIAAPFVPKGAWQDTPEVYDQNDLVESGGFVFVSNHDANEGNPPVVSGGIPASNAHWTYLPLPTVQQVLTELGVHRITISEDDPSGGVDGDIWFKVAP